jgi:large subunit ribosomal protein L25
MKAKSKTALQEELTVRRRPTTGTRPVNRLRREGLVPGVVYGRNMEPITVAVNQRELMKLLHSRTGEHALVTLRLEEPKSWEKPALVKAVQHDPVDGHVVHVDFHAILLTERLRVKVPVVLKGEPVGVKQEGGILEHFLREVEVESLPTEIPARVEFDVSALKIGETVHVSDLVPPKNAKITSDPAGVIASVQTPKEEKPKEEAAVAEPEVIREKKEEGEAAVGEETKGERPEAKKDTKP